MNSQRPQSLPVTETLDPLLGKMRCIATGLLVLMSFLYVLARSFEGNGSLWPWLREFPEAAMVGAIADWFDPRRRSQLPSLKLKDLPYFRLAVISASVSTFTPSPLISLGFFSSGRGDEP